MASRAEEAGGSRTGPWRKAMWGAAAFLLLLPLAAMQFTDEVDWGVGDFLLAGAMMGGTGLLFELAVRTSRSFPYRAGVGVALAASFLLVWINGAVGIIGTEDNPLNLMYGGVLFVALAGTITARFQPKGMGHAMTAAALGHGVVGAIALLNGYFTLVLEAFFVGLWLIAAALFRKSAREQEPQNSA